LITSDLFNVGRFTCSQKMTRWPA